MRRVEIIFGHSGPGMGYYFINEDDKAIESLEKFAEMHQTDPDIVTGFCNYTRLYDNPRFIAICEKMNLPLPKTE